MHVEQLRNSLLNVKIVFAENKSLKNSFFLENLLFVKINVNTFAVLFERAAFL